MNFQQRDILTNDNGTILLRVYRKGIQVSHTYDLLNADTSFPQPVENSSLSARLASGELSLVQPEGTLRVTPAMRAYAKKAFSRIAAATEDELLLLSETGRAAAFRLLHANDPKLTWKTFYKCIRLYFACGGTPAGMLPKFDRCGYKRVDLTDIMRIPFAEARAKCQEQSISLQKHNPQHKDDLIWEDSDGEARERREVIAGSLYRCDRETLRVFMHYYRLMKGEGAIDLPTLLIKLHHDVFSTTINRQVDVWDLQCIPTMHMFEYWYERLHTYGEKRRHRKTDNEIAKTERAQLGDERTRAIAAGTVGAGDATIFNVGIINSFPTADIIGPPVVFRIRCESTGMLLGLSVCLRSASYDGFAKAIANCLEDKVEFCARYDIAISEEDWPAQGLPGAIHADCGETDNKKINTFINATGVRLTNLWAGRPEFRGGNESDWNTLELSMMPLTPGACLRKWYEYQPGPPWQTRAEHTVWEFTRLLLLYELLRMKKPRTGVGLTSQEIADGVDGSPLSMWNWCVGNRGGGLRSFNLSEVQLALLEEAPCSLTEHGLEFRKMKYLPKKMISSDVFAHAARHGRSGEKCAFDDNLCDHVYLLPEVEGDPVVLYEINTKLTSQHDFKGKSFTEVQRLFAEKDKNNLAQADAHYRAAVQTQADAIAMSELSKERNAGASGRLKSPSRQMRDMPAARQAETDRYQPTTALQPFVDSVEPDAVNNVVSIIAPSKKRKRNSTFRNLANNLATAEPHPLENGESR